ncbi:hypothetical protein I79_007207 [Cricetulus griseus]|uniref:Uncharacterized protein n=1 Tax=Cricetulus griseus TaxID=10029 RepID=G3H9X6_CRIGR|nr:hypothetical protein I79_007207 [Cricetulus griseus]
MGFSEWEGTLSSSVALPSNFSDEESEIWKSLTFSRSHSTSVSSNNYIPIWGKWLSLKKSLFFEEKVSS